jgi:branched-chain amino acid transport system ATP-binding protein
LLRLEGVEAYYGSVRALSGVSLEVPDGAIVTLLGANGAGKTTTLRTIMGLLRPAGGTVTYRNERIDRLPTDAIVRRGISMVPERRELFPEMTVEENLIMGAFSRSRREIAGGLERVYELFPDLRARRGQVAQTLSGGQQQMVAIGRALMARPRLLLLDEPTLGLAPLIVKRMFEVIARINGDGVTILLIEQNAYRALPISRFGYVLETGRIVLAGDSRQMLEDPRVKGSYLGDI